MEKPKLYYCFDPFCGWCYGFGDNITAAEIKFSDRIDFEVLCGGMITGTRIQPLSEVSSYLLDAIPEVEKKTGAEFGEAFIDLLRKGAYTPNSFPPSIAIQVFKSLSSERHIEFAHELQKSYYKFGEDIKSDHYFVTLASRFDLNPNQFMDRYKHLDYLKKTEEEIRFVNGLGVHGFPTVLGEHNGKRYILSRGYVNKEDLFGVINTWYSESMAQLN